LPSDFPAEKAMNRELPDPDEARAVHQALSRLLEILARKVVARFRAVQSPSPDRSAELRVSEPAGESQADSSQEPHG
jgi:hypothetical protein